MILVPFSASMFSLLAIAMDRYLFITNCIQYPRIMTHKRVRILILVVWSIALFNALSIAMPWTYPSASGREFCTCMIVEASSDLYLFLYSIFFNLIPITLISIFYCLIVVTALNAQKRHASLHSNCMKMSCRTDEERKFSFNHFNLIKVKRIWKKRGIPVLGVLIASVALLWLPLSCGMLVFVAQKDFR